MSVNVELATSGNMWKVLVKLGQAVVEGENTFHYGGNENGSASRCAVCWYRH